MLFLLSASVLAARTFKIEGDNFVLDGKTFRYLSGSFHYFRQHPDHWEDTIKKMAVGGLNAVQTYVAWNLHEPQKGEINFSGLCDIERFLTICKKLNMYVILRPGPYICAEWEFGGLPWWLLRELKANQFRRMDTTYIGYVDKWMTALYKKVAPFMIHNGGTVIMVQVENEYGNYNACDKTYMKYLADLAKRNLGEETFLFTTDGNNKNALNCGTIPGVFATIDFGVGGNITGSFNLMKSHNGHGPYVCSEYWDGWFDIWGKKHETRDPAKVASDIDTMLTKGGSVNNYMYEGGTNFGFMSGANGNGGTSYSPVPTAYDYDAPLNEAGDMTRKWTSIQTVARKHNVAPAPNYEVKNSVKKNFGTVYFTKGVSLWDALPSITGYHQSAENALTFEALGLDYGYILYRATTTAGSLNLGRVNDRAYVYVDKKRHGIVARTKEAPVTVPAGQLDILVENMGRINYGNNFVENKGLIQGAKVAGAIKTWEHYGFNLSKVNKLEWTDDLPWRHPGFFKATFQVDAPADTFLNPKGWTKGVAIVNGFNLGRYWTIGPQLTLFVPGPILKAGANELIIFEAENTEGEKTMSFDAVSQLSIIK
jgi:beta-galactosidase GanA